MLHQRCESPSWSVNAAELQDKIKIYIMFAKKGVLLRVLSVII